MNYLLTKSVKYVMSRRTFLLNALAVTDNDESLADHVGGRRKKCKKPAGWLGAKGFSVQARRFLKTTQSKNGEPSQKAILRDE